MATVDATAVRCRGCEAEVSVYEEGLCAFCRMEARGDGALLSHDSRGYLDHDGVTRVPCGCGCNGPVRVEDETLEQVKDILGHGQEVEIRLPREPQAWRREWIEQLGGRIVIDPEAPMPLALQRDNEEDSMNGIEGLEALKAMDNGEAQQPERSAMTNGKRPQGYWTRERIIEAIKAFNQEHGRPPITTDWTKAAFDHPSIELVKRVMGSWADAIEDAGFERPRRGHRVEPIAPQATPPAPEPEPEPEPAPLPAPLAPPEPPAPSPVAADPEKVDVFELFESMATDERIAHYERVAEQAQLKAEALRSIRDALSTVRELEPA